MGWAEYVYSILQVPSIKFSNNSSAWKSGPKTGKKPRPDRDQTTWDRKFAGTGKDRNCGLVFGPSLSRKFEDREKTSLNRSQPVFTQVIKVNLLLFNLILVSNYSRLR